jgi:hypothetical protein
MGTRSKYTAEPSPKIELLPAKKTWVSVADLLLQASGPSDGNQTPGNVPPPRHDWDKFRAALRVSIFQKRHTGILSEKEKGHSPHKIGTLPLGYIASSRGEPEPLCRLDE